MPTPSAIYKPTSGGNGSSITHAVTLTNGSGANRCLLLGIMHRDGSDVVLNTVTFNGVAGTLVRSQVAGNDRTKTYVYRWLDSELPASPGSYNAYVEAAAVIDILCVLPVECIDVDQTTPVEASNSAAVNTGSTVQTTVAPFTAGNLMIDFGFGWLANQPAYSISADAGQTRQVHDAYSGGGQTLRIFSSTATDDGTMGWSEDTAAAIAMPLVALSLTAAAGGGPSITNMEDERFHWGESGIVITGSGFGT